MAKLPGLEHGSSSPPDSAQARIDAIAAEGATVDVVDGSYDDAVMLSASLADDDHIVISDTSWPGYEDVPGWVADGFSTIFEELAEQLGDEPAPPLFPIQIGVGALACASDRARRRAARHRRRRRTRQGSTIRDDGRRCSSRADGSIMAGLNWAPPRGSRLPDIAADHHLLHVEDTDAEEAEPSRTTCAAARPARRGSRICSPCAPTARRHMGALRARAEPVALVICTEAPTDARAFERITGSV